MFIGIDIIEINRIEQAVKEQGDKFLNRFYTKREIKKYAALPQSLAARFAAKEAVIKAMDAAGKGISYKDIEVLAEPGGKPLITLHEKAKLLAETLGITGFSVSLSHSDISATAIVIGELI